MNGSCKEFFTRTAFSIQKHRAVGRSNLLDLFKDGKDFRALSNNIFEAETVEEFLPEVEVFFHQTFLFDGSLNHQDQFFVGERFGEIVKGPQFHGLYCVLNSVITCHDDHNNPWFCFSNGPENLHAIYIGQLHIEEDQVVITLPDQVRALSACHAGLNDMVFIRERQAASFADHGFVINHQNLNRFHIYLLISP